MNNFIRHCKECKNPINILDVDDIRYFNQLPECCQLTAIEIVRQDNKRYAYNKACQESGYQI